MRGCCGNMRSAEACCGGGEWQHSFSVWTARREDGLCMALEAVLRGLTRSLAMCRLAAVYVRTGGWGWAGWFLSLSLGKVMACEAVAGATPEVSAARRRWVLVIAVPQCIPGPLLGGHRNGA